MQRLSLIRVHYAWCRHWDRLSLSELANHVDILHVCVCVRVFVFSVLVELLFVVVFSAVLYLLLTLAAASVWVGWLRVSLCVLHYERKMTWAINTQFSRNTGHDCRSASIDPGVKRSKFKVTQVYCWYGRWQDC